MKSLDTLQKLSRIGRVLSKIVFVFGVIGFCGCAAGLISLCFANGRLVQIGGVTLHGLVDLGEGGSGGYAAAKLSGWLIICAGQAVLARFAERYFKNELSAGLPFTLPGAMEMRRLGILTIVIPIVCDVAAQIAASIIAELMNVELASYADSFFRSRSDVVLGIMFLIASVIFRYGASIVHDLESKNHGGK